MKQSTNSPLFRNCPNADIFKRNLRSDCRRCELYEECIKMKARRVYKRKQKIRKRKTVLVVFSALATVLVCKIHNNSLAMEKHVQVENEVVVEEYSIVETEEFETEEYASEVEIEIVKDEIEFSKEEVEVVQYEETEEIMQEPRISAYEPGDVYYYNISAEDKMYMAKLLYKEARGEIYEGKVGVACTVLNRYYSGDARFERDSIYSVITQSGAYASIEDVTIEMVKEIPELEQAVEDACRGWDPTRKMFAEGALFFYAPKEVKGYQKEIREGIQVLQIGNHNFHNDFNK